MDDRKIALIVLVIIALVAVAGFVAIIKGKSTGEFTHAGSFIQYQPREACERIGCTFKEGFQMAQPYREIGGAPHVLCECPDGAEITVPIVQRIGREY